MKKGLIAALALGVLVTAGAMSIGQVKAEQERGQRGEQMQVRQEEKLNQAVSNGVLSEDQKQALETKHEEMRQERDANREAHKAEMDQWFQDNGIDHEAMMEYMGGPGPRQGGGRGFRNK